MTVYVVSSPARLLIVLRDARVSRTVLLASLMAAVLFFCQAVWPRYALACVRHAVDAGRSLQLGEDVDCSFSRVSLLGPDGSWAVQEEEFVIELRNVSVADQAGRWAVVLETGGSPRAAVVLAAFPDRSEADALAAQLGAFLASTLDERHEGELLRFRLTSDASWVAGVVAGFLLAAAAALAVLVPSGREALEMSASTGTATLSWGGIVPLWVRHRSFPIERVARVLVATDTGAILDAGDDASASRVGRLRVDVADVVSGRKDEIWLGPSRRAGDASVSLGVLGGSGAGCCAAGPSLLDVSRRCGLWLRAYAETGAGTPGGGVPQAGCSDAEDGVLGRQRRGSVLVPPAPSGSGDCVVCRADRPSVALQPCLHLCLCGGCARGVANGRILTCPICRAAIESTLRLQLV